MYSGGVPKVSIYFFDSIMFLWMLLMYQIYIFWFFLVVKGSKLLNLFQILKTRCSINHFYIAEKKKLTKTTRFIKLKKFHVTGLVTIYRTLESKSVEGLWASLHHLTIVY